MEGVYLPLLGKVVHNPLSILTEPQSEDEEQRRRPGHLLLGVAVCGDGAAEPRRSFSLDLGGCVALWRGCDVIRTLLGKEMVFGIGGKMKGKNPRFLKKFSSNPEFGFIYCYWFLTVPQGFCLDDVRRDA